MVINPIVGVYIPIIRIPLKGGMTIPNIATCDHGTFTELVGKLPVDTFDKIHATYLMYYPIVESATTIIYY